MSRALQLSVDLAKKIYNRLWDLKMPPGGHLQNSKFTIGSRKFYYCPCDVTISENLGSRIYYVFCLSPLLATSSASGNDEGDNNKTTTTLSVRRQRSHTISRIPNTPETTIQSRVEHYGVATASTEYAPVISYNVYICSIGSANILLLGDTSL